MKDILEIHNLKCTNPSTTVQVSLDGVSECKSNINSMDIFSIRFANCRTVYPVKIIRPIGKFRVDVQTQLDDFLTDVCLNHCHIHSFVGDSQKRSNVKCCKGHGAYFPCEYCECKGQLLHDLDSSLKSKKKKNSETQN